MQSLPRKWIGIEVGIGHAEEDLFATNRGIARPYRIEEVANVAALKDKCEVLGWKCLVQVIPGAAPAMGQDDARMPGAGLRSPGNGSIRGKC